MSRPRWRAPQCKTMGGRKIDEHASIRLLRVIARLNVGGPSIQALTLTKQLAQRGYDTTLVRGREGPREGTMDHLAAELGVAPVVVNSLQRAFGPHDALALMRMLWILMRMRPTIMHTHAAKAGALGRLAAVLLGRFGPPVRVHTFHGHVLTGYFSPRLSAVFLGVERFLARRSTRLIAVSEEVRDDLVKLGVAPVERIEIVPLGFDLDPFTDDKGRPERRASFRTSIGVGLHEVVVTLVARLVPIKRVDRFLLVARLVHQWHPDVRFVVVGDGEMDATLQCSADARALGGQLVWAGMRLDMPSVYAGSDIVLLTSDNEGTPVSLIEAQAAGVPTVATRVGGVGSVVIDGETGWTLPPDDVTGLARAVGRLIDDPEERVRIGRRGREHVSRHFRLDRLVDDVDRLYRSLLAERSPWHVDAARNSDCGSSPTVES